jgi:hypothetical protein
MICLLLQVKLFLSWLVRERVQRYRLSLPNMLNRNSTSLSTLHMNRSSDPNSELLLVSAPKNLGNVKYFSHKCTSVNDVLNKRTSNIVQCPKQFLRCIEYIVVTETWGMDLFYHKLYITYSILIVFS